MSFIENGKWEVVDHNETVDVFYQPGYININTIRAGDSFKCDGLEAIGQNGNCRIPLTDMRGVAGEFPIMITNMDVHILVESKTSFTILPHGKDGIVLIKVDDSA